MWRPAFIILGILILAEHSQAVEALSTISPEENFTNYLIQIRMGILFTCVFVFFYNILAQYKKQTDNHYTTSNWSGNSKKEVPKKSEA